MSLAIVYRVSIPAPATHLVRVETSFASLAGPLPEELVLYMPVWTPGSYLVREYARNVEGISVDGPARLEKVRKNAWRLATGHAPRVTVRYEVYAGELTVRTSHVDEEHAFLVGAGLFMAAEGHESSPARVEIEPPAGWRVATALGDADSSADAILAYQAPDFDALVDAPIELGTFREISFDVLGVPHRLALCPSNQGGANASALEEADVQRLVADTRTIVETLAGFFGGTLPYDRYLLLLHLSAHARGGLEHRASAALIAAASGFASRAGYLEILSLVAHEMFHAWNVKRIRPAGLVPYRYGEECYTRLLWWFEGATSYYDWRTLVLSRLCTVEEYLEHLAAEIAYVEQTPGRLFQSLEDASFDAWIKLYRPDENLANSGVSYYRKGEVVCALLDVAVRARTGGRVTLDRILSHLWERYGAMERPLPEGAMQGVFEELTGLSWGPAFDAWVRGTGELECAQVLADAGIGLERLSRPEGASGSIGVRLRVEAGRSVVGSVVRGSGAWSAGIAAGDEIVALGGSRIEAGSLDAALRGRPPGEAVEVVVARQGHVLTRMVSIDLPRKDAVKLVALDGAPPTARATFEAWLGRSHPAWSNPSRAST